MRCMALTRRPSRAKGFKILPRRWVAEHTFAWFWRSRKLAKDWEITIESAIDMSVPRPFSYRYTKNRKVLKSILLY